MVELRLSGGGRVQLVEERILKYKEASLATGKQTIEITLAEGTTRSIKEVVISVGSNGNEWGADGYFQAHRAENVGSIDEAEPSETLIGETYFGSGNVLLLDKDNFGSDPLFIVIDHNAGTNKDVYITIRYYYR